MLSIMQIRSYHEQNGNKEIPLIVDAIIDKESGLGILWASAELDKWFDALKDYPANWVIGQHRDYLARKVRYLTNGCTPDLPSSTNRIDSTTKNPLI